MDITQFMAGDQDAWKRRDARRFRALFTTAQEGRRA